MKDSIMTLSDIEEKDVINVVTGERIGFVSSLELIPIRDKLSL